jgi:hypothetical protein
MSPLALALANIITPGESHPIFGAVDMSLANPELPYTNEEAWTGPRETVTAPVLIWSTTPTPAVAPQVSPIQNITEETFSKVHIDSVFLADLINAFMSTGDGRCTKSNVASAFVELSNDERDALWSSPARRSKQY